MEKIGGLFMWVAALFSKTPKDLPFDMQGVVFSNPVGMPAGWIDSPQKAHTLVKFGAGVRIIKTITVKPLLGNPYPRIIRSEDTLINSLGLPNKGLAWWVEYFQSHTLPYPVVVSIKGTSLAEWAQLLQTLDPYVDVFELNFSCPNVEHGVMDLVQSSTIVREVAQFTLRPLLLKLSPEYPPAQNLALVQVVKQYIAGVSLINTLPTFHAKLGNPQKIGGQSGSTLYPSLIAHLRVFRSVYPTFSELAIFASGGVNEHNCVQILQEYRAIPLALTRFLTHGPSIYRKMLEKIYIALSPAELHLLLS